MNETRKTPTRNDVAKLAGVSPAVVSYVLNNSNYVSDDKREAVMTAVEQLGYYPNVLAQALRKKKSSQIALICDNVLYNEWLYDIDHILFEQKYYVSMCHCQPSDEFLQMLMQRQYEAVFMMSNVFDEKQLNGLADSGIPIVLFKTRPYAQLSSHIATVAPNYADGVKKGVDYLALKGHKRIAYIPPMRYPTTGINGTDFRIRGYAEAMEHNGLELSQKLVCVQNDSINTICDSILEMISGNAAERPTAFIVANDYLAAQVMQYLKKLGMRIPEDVAVIGSDNANVASLTSPTLTTVDFSKFDFAHAVVQSMMSLMQNNPTPDLYLPVRLEIRESA